MRCIAWLVVLVCTTLPGAPVAAQDRGSIAVLGGVTEVDLSGVATTAVVALRATTRLDRALVFEGGLAYIPYGSQAGVTVHHAFPEAQAQLQLIGGRVRPYLGAGVGVSLERWPDETSTDLTVAGAAGVRFPIGVDWGLQGELRVRSVDPWAGTTADFTAGLYGRF